MVFSGGEAVETCVRAVVVVVATPCRDQMSGGAQRGEQVLVRTFVSQTPVEVLAILVLLRRPGFRYKRSSL